MLDTEAILPLTYCVKDVLNLLRSISMIQVQFVHRQVKFIKKYLWIGFVPGVCSFIKVWLLVLSQSFLSIRSLKEVGLVNTLRILHEPEDMDVQLRAFNLSEFGTKSEAKRVKVLSHFFGVDHCCHKLSLDVRLVVIRLVYFHRRYIYLPHVLLPSVLLKFVHNLWVLVDVDLNIATFALHWDSTHYIISDFWSQHCKDGLGLNSIWDDDFSALLLGNFV
jgi:hypothetical protein